MKHGGNVWQGGVPSDWLDFSANLRPEGPPDWVQNVLRCALDSARYYPDRSMKEARLGLAGYLGIDPDCILPTAGGESAIDLALSCRSGSVIIEQPTFGAYADRASAHKREVSQTTDYQMGDTVVLCNPNNPTGRILSVEEVLEHHGEIREKGGELVVDEAFIDYCPQYSVRRSACEDLTIVGSLTKILCIPGVRLGYLIADAARIRRLEEMSLSWPLNAFASAVAGELPMHREEIEADAALNRMRAERFAARLRAVGAKTECSAVPFLLVDFGRDMTGIVQMLRKNRVLVRTCDSFGFPNHVLRIAVRTDEENEYLLEYLCQE